MFSVNAVGNKIATRIRQAEYDPFGLESLMYMGKQCVPMYAHEIKKSSWSQIQWINLPRFAGECCEESRFIINGPASSINAMDYLMAVALEACFPRIELKPTCAPSPFFYQYLITNAGTTGLPTVPETPFPNIQTFIQQAIQPSLNNPPQPAQVLYFYVSNCNSSLPKNTIYIGSQAALTTGLGVTACCLTPLETLCPKRRVAWGQNAFLAALECVSFRIDDVDIEELNTQALYNAIQERQREDVYPVAGMEATSLDAVEIESSTDVNVVLEDTGVKAFTVPFSFTTSGLADRGEEGKFKSAYPVLLSCTNNIEVFTRQRKCLLDLLVLKEEILCDFATFNVVFLATNAELTQPTGVHNSLFFTNGTNTYVIDFANFTLLPSSTSVFPQGVYATSSNAAVSPFAFYFNNQLITESAAVLVSDFQFGPISSTGEFSVLTRKCDGARHDNCLACDICFEDWFDDFDQNVLCIKARALSSTITAVERAWTKRDCRSRQYMYEHYTYICPSLGAFNHCTKEVNFDLTCVPGLFKYSYLVAQNETSRLQGHFFNYTSDTDFLVVNDYYPCFNRYVFCGKAAICFAKVKIRGYRDMEMNYPFIRYVDNPLFSQRAPRDHGLIIFPRYSNFINSIYPDGGVNMQLVDCATLCVNTCKSAIVSKPACSPNFGKECTVGYAFELIAVSEDILLFE